MKVEEIRIGLSPLTKNIYAGKLNKKGNQWLSKKNVTDDFLNCVVQYFQDIDLDEIIRILRTIKNETRPIENHTDPNAIQDCWNEVFERFEEIKSKINF